jgi:hypothetical protein
MAINDNYPRNHRLEAVALNESIHTTVRWGAIFAGALIALLVYATLISLGMAFGGDSLQNVVTGEASAKSLGIGAGIWLVASVLLSLLAGGFVSGRVAGQVATRVGRIQGMVVSGLFFALMFSQAGSMIGSIGNGIGSVAGTVGNAAGNVAQTDEAQALIDDAIGDLNLKSPPETVAKGVASRLIRGNDDAALTYLARQANITRAEAQARIETVKAQFDQAVIKAGDTAGRAVEIAGWTLFGALFLGTLFSMVGGGIGAQMNLRAPLSRADEHAISKAA